MESTFQKKIIYTLLILTVSLMSSCDYFTEVFWFSNQSDDNITVIFGYLDERNDTTIIVNKKTGGLSKTMVDFFRSPISPNDSSLYYPRGKKNYTDNIIRHKYHGMMHIFVVKSEDVEKYGWEEVTEKNMVLQRYDVTDSDLEKTNRFICFPPTPAMVHISMWPPYGTYPTRPNK